ncbi:MAG: endonuclease [Planctomycetes bacterium]|nr:endonuclease [Planctomycetota bacterium]
MRLLLLAAAVVALAPLAATQAPPGYYNSVDPTSAVTLRSTLHAVIDGHTKIPYTSGSTDTWDVLEQADQDPTNAGRILDLYKNAVYTKQGGGNTLYNREHTWPNSYGFPNDGATNLPYTDCHQLFLCDITYNGDRGNLYFDNGNSGWQEYTTLANAGHGGGSGTFPGNSDWRGSNGWQVWSDRKGDVARALFYLDVRYEGGGSEPDLILTDNTSLIQTTGGNASVAYMGKLSVLLQWHQQDPPDQKEMTRNDVVHGFQGNRNPFIDHPEWADCIFGGVCTPTQPSGRQPERWINELHYDNAGTDVNEFVEVAGRAGERLDGWMLVGYDGSNGTAYKHLVLRGALPNQQNGFGTMSFAFVGLQNGNPDGIALVSPDGVVVQFLSYGGAFTAQNGAANGRQSVDIGVAESSTAPLGTSLRLSGSGSGYAAFTWQPSAASSAGSVNAGQTFQ